MEKRVIVVSSALLARIRNGPPVPKNGHRQVRCCWCFTPKIKHNKPCEVCGHNGNTTIEQKQINRVFVEEVED